MCDITRRKAIIAGVAAACAVAIPSVGAASPRTMTAEMFYTVDEPWGMFVRGHVTQKQFDEAALDLLNKDSDTRDNCEDWLFDEVFDDDGDEFRRVITADAEHSYMRLARTDDPELGDAYERCRADAHGAIPITVVMY